MLFPFFFFFTFSFLSKKSTEVNLEFWKVLGWQSWKWTNHSSNIAIAKPSSSQCSIIFFIPLLEGTEKSFYLQGIPFQTTNQISFVSPPTTADHLGFHPLYPPDTPPTLSQYHFLVKPQTIPPLFTAGTMFATVNDSTIDFPALFTLQSTAPYCAEAKHTISQGASLRQE